MIPPRQMPDRFLDGGTIVLGIGSTVIRSSISIRRHAINRDPASQIVPMILDDRRCRPPALAEIIFGMDRERIIQGRNPQDATVERTTNAPYENTFPLLDFFDIHVTARL